MGKKEYQFLFAVEQLRQLFVNQSVGIAQEDGMMISNVLSSNPDVP